MKVKNITFILTFCLITYYTSAQQNSQKVEASINQAIAGSFQEITFTYTIGDEKITRGGGIRFEFPRAYAETEFLFWSKPQTREPDLLGYVSGKTSTGTEVELVAYGMSEGIFQCTLQNGTLTKGDKIVVKYKGQVQSLARDFIVRAQIRTGSDKAWQDVQNTPHINLLPQEAHTLVVTSPSNPVIGKPFAFSVVVLDKFGNLSSSYRGKINIQSSDKQAMIPESYSFTEEDKGMHVFQNVKYNSIGFQKIIIETSDKLKTSTHFSFVSESERKYKRYFGDTHFHTGTGSRNRGFITTNNVHKHSTDDVSTLPQEILQKLNSAGDHRGNFTTAEEAYIYARDVTRLDFASASEHDAYLFDDQAWKILQGISQKFYNPGKFTTLFAYEWTSGITHHIVLYKEKDLKVFDRRAHPDLPSLWSALDEQGKPALTIPHLTWNFKEHINWDYINNDYRKLGEIYSLWNSRFLIQPGDDPQRFELGKDNKWSFQYAWDKGHKIGVIGSTDNHLGQPGTNNYTIYTQHTGGLAVALSAANNREQLWDALETRRTYATTGTRIYVDFTVNGSHMGSEIKSEKSPVIIGKVAGTNMLETVEVVKYVNSNYNTIYKSSPDSEITEFEFEDENFDSDCFYYLRVTQVDEVPGRLWAFPTKEKAWSSPVWVEFIK